MSPRRPRREELAAAVLAPVVVAIAIFGWIRRDASSTVCCGPDRGVALDAPIPDDSSLRTGRLSNGLRYYVRANDSPEHRAELRLVVNAGSVLEANDQRGLAHAVEHMLFRGTTHFPRHAVDDYLQSIGMRPGSDVNASTSQDETIVQITVPTDRAGVLDTSLAILADMAHEVTFDRGEARQEAGVVMSEWRSGADAASRLRHDRDTLLFSGSPYAAREVIGDTAVLRRFDVAAMRRFYSDWYRPDLMAVVVVGDFDSGAAVERLIKRRFGPIPPTTNGRTRPVVSVPAASAPRATVLRDPEATTSRVALWHLRTPTPLRRLGDYREMLITELWQRVLDDRLDDASEQAGSPVLSSSVDVNSIGRTLDADIVRVHPMDQREGAALEMLASEVHRLGRDGVTAAEVRRRGATLLRERRNTEEWSDESADIADALADQFLTGSVFVSRSRAAALTHDLLPTITAADVAARARGLAIDSTALIVVTEPARAGAPPQPTELIALARAAADRSPPPTVDAAAPVRLMPTLPEPGRIASEHIVSDARVFDWTLANGMRVILKPTRFSNDEIEFRIRGSGGASIASVADYPSAFYADGVVTNTGVGPLSGRRLSRMLDETSVVLSASVSDDGIDFRGSAAPRDLDLLFQVLHLYFTQPRSDTVAFRRYRERLATYVRGRAADPDAVFDDTVAAVLADHHERARRGDERFSLAVDLSKALDFWKSRTANAASFTLVMTGDFAIDRVRPLVARYLASLPGGTAEQSRDVSPRFPSGTVRRQIVAGMGPKARTKIVFSGPFDATNEGTSGLGAARDVAELALSSHLRERLGGTYDASVHSSLNLIPPATYSLTVDFEAAPERIDSLATAALAVLDRLRTSGPTDLELEKIRAARVRDLDGKIESNSYWANELAWHARLGWPLGTIANHQVDAKLLSKSTLHAACKTYLGAANYVQVTMYPRR